jgi:hypothetical protein
MIRIYNYTKQVIKKLAVALTMLVFGGTGMWAQTDYSGVYYIANGNGYDAANTANNFYLVPATNADYTTGQPHLTTAKTGQVENSCWNVVKTGDYYHIIHVADGKYLTANPAYDGTKDNDIGRLRVHLEAMDVPDNNTLFEINPNGTAFNIRHKDMNDKVNNKTTTYLDPAGGNKEGTDLTDYRQASTSSGKINVGGGIGYWTDELAARWYFESAISIAAPTITNNYNGTFTITAATGAAIYYTTDGSTPTLSAYTGTGTTSVNVSQTDNLTVIKAIAKAASDSYHTYVVVYELPVCERPVFSIQGNKIVMTCATEDAEIHYTTNGDPATSSSPLYTGPITKENGSEIRAVATSPGFVTSGETVLLPPTEVSSSSEITDMTENYILASDFTSTASIGTSADPFRGTIDGDMIVLSGLDHPLVAYADGAIIKNVILDNVSISGGTNVGAICGEATGSTRIYNCGVLATNSTVETDKDGYNTLTNCSSTISGSNYVGGIVGLLDGSARVINCFSYAHVSGGSYVGGIVGYNNVATKSNNLKTMVMNCMFYGEVSGSSRAPIYNGSIITNRSDQAGVSNFNYFWAGASYVQNKNIDVYNCALSAETRYLQRFEFYRHLLNSNRALAAWWATGSEGNVNEMKKWVLEPSQIGSTTPYPILKTPGKYFSVVNIDADHTEAFASDAATKKTQYNQGRKFGELTIYIQNASSGAPAGANIDVTSVTPNITDKDPAHFNFNYYKVQLPYYNDVGTKNYTGNKVVTGWKIVSISGGTHSFSTGSDATATVDGEGELTLTTPYNFADRKSTDKDLYSVGERVFSQGAYFDVPEGVSSITIEPYWAKCVYVSDEYLDVVYNQSMNNGTPAYVTTIGDGARYTNAIAYDFNGSSQNVYTTMANAVVALDPSGSVYDNAIVLVGNVHSLNLSDETKDKPFTIMSIDLDKDNEPDYSYILRFDSRKRVHPVRIDFLNVIGLGMAQKSFGGTGTYNLGIMQPYGWFECTNTGLFRVTQLEYDYVNSNVANTDRAESPMILLGGVIEQWVTVGGSEVNHKEAKSVTYYHVGSNVWFKEFHIGVHQDKTQEEFVSPHPPISVTGGDYDIFYLTGYYNSPSNKYADNAECYINGGRFDKVAGTGMQGIGSVGGAGGTGNIVWQIDNADINEFYGGGINAAHIAEGNIMTIITNSRVDQFCGGPKFGDMNSDKKVVTNASNCIFRTFFGAGYGGNSYNRRYPQNQNNVTNIDWNSWVSGTNGIQYRYNASGVESRIDYQFIPMSNNTKNVARLFVDYVSFSLATTHDVTSKLKDCTITTSPLGTLNLFSQCVGNFYGGGNLGMVAGPVKSTLTNCVVEGHVFGAGYSASLPPVAVMNNNFQTEPYYDENLGAYLDAVLPSTVTYTWQHRDVVNSVETAIDKTNHILFTPVDLTNLGAVTGDVTLTIDGNTTVSDDKVMSVAKSVFGGGEESGVVGDTYVSVKGGSIGAQGLGGAVYGNVYGGGKGTIENKLAGLVNGNTHVVISGSPTIYHNIYGGGAIGSVGDFTYSNETGLPTALHTNNTGACYVTVLGGNIGTTGINNGMVLGASRGGVDVPDNEGVDLYDQMAWVYDTHIIIGTQGSETGPSIAGSIYGSGENGHTFADTDVKIYSGTIGVTDRNIDGGPRYPYRGNVYGGGCGTDTYVKNEKTYYNPMAGIVWGNTNLQIFGGHVAHNVYGGGAMGTVGKYAYVDEAYNTAHSEATLPLGKPYECLSGGLCQVTISGGLIGATGATMTAEGGPDDFGHVFGAGRGEMHDPALFPNLEVACYFNMTQLTISDQALVTGSIYGGSESGHVLGNTNVIIAGGQIGCGVGADRAYSDWDAETLAPTDHWPFEYNGRPHDQYADASGNYPEMPADEDGPSARGGYPSATDGHTFYGNVFAGGSGYYPYAPGKWLRSAGRVEGNASVTISGGHVLNNVYGGCEMADILGSATVLMTDGTVGVPRSAADIVANPVVGHIYGGGMGDKRIFFNTSTNVASTSVNVLGGKVYGSVYGGGEDGHVLNNAVTTIRQADNDIATVIGTVGTTGYDGNIFGGGQGSSMALTSGVVGGNAILNVQDGTILGSVYGGGRIASVGTYFAMAKIIDPSSGEEVDNPDYGKMQSGDDHGVITVNLTGGTIEQNVYGGCMGTTENDSLGVSKNVTVKLNENVADDARGCAVKGFIFGCNNVNSSPQGDVLVHVYKTQRAGQTRITNPTEGPQTAKVLGTRSADGNFVLESFDVKAVYGGGNMAAYMPLDLANGSTHVIIDGCDRTSIGQVYGGGNAASTPATNVEVNGTFEIGELFGGGNGKDSIVVNNIKKKNPGANVGFLDYSDVENDERWDTKEERATNADFIARYSYGSGEAVVNVKGGTIHRVFGGSNTKGNVRKTALTILEEVDNNGIPLCAFHVDEAYGGGKSAPMDAEAKLIMACIPGLTEVYGGAQAADVFDDVTLTITNGNFNRVFGGNNISGTIRGKITINIEETGCRPVVIGELYGGGNEAGYSVYGYDEDGSLIETASSPLYGDPEVNVKSFTNIGTIYGGGYGTNAVMIANPTVNVNVVLGDYAVDGRIGTIGDVFGGGNAAKVIGNTQVNIGTATGEDINMISLPILDADGNPVLDANNKPTYTKKRVLGANITGNVYGGGNNAEVTGSANVTIGKQVP